MITNVGTDVQSFERTKVQIEKQNACSDVLVMKIIFLLVLFSFFLHSFYIMQFLPRCMERRRALAMRILSVRLFLRLSVKRVHYDKMEERSVQIFNYTKDWV